MNREGMLLIYYGGFGFAIFLGWAATVGAEINSDLTAVRRVRFDRAARALALVGLLHPALAMTGLDIARQLARFDDLATARSLATLRVSGWSAAASVALAVAVFIASVSG